MPLPYVMHIQSMDTKKNNSNDYSDIIKDLNSKVAYKVGKVLYYYEKSKVAIIELTSDIGVGEKLKVANEEEEFELEVDNIKVGNDKVEEAFKGQTIVISTKKVLKPGMEVFKL